VSGNKVVTSVARIPGLECCADRCSLDAMRQRVRHNTWRNPLPDFCGELLEDYLTVPFPVVWKSPADPMRRWYSRVGFIRPKNDPGVHGADPICVDQVNVVANDRRCAARTFVGVRRSDCSVGVRLQASEPATNSFLLLGREICDKALSCAFTTASLPAERMRQTGLSPRPSACAAERLRTCKA